MLKIIYINITPKSSLQYKQPGRTQMYQFRVLPYNNFILPVLMEPY